MIKGHGHRMVALAKPRTWSNTICPWCKMHLAYDQPVLCREKLVHPHCRENMESQTTKRRRQFLEARKRKEQEERLRKVKDKNDQIRGQKKQRAKQVDDYFIRRISDTARALFFNKSRSLGMLKEEQLAVWNGSKKVRDRYKKEILAELMRAIDKILPVKGER